MKKMKCLSILFTTLLIALMGCSKADPEPGPQTPKPPQPGESVFSFKIHETTSSTVDYTITPKNEQMSYLALIIKKELFDSFGSDEEFIQYEMDRFAELASQYGVPIEQLLAGNLHRGVRSEIEEGLTPGTEYYLYAYGLTDALLVTTAVEKVLFSTQEVELQEAHFEIEIFNIDYTTAEIRITAEPKNIDYFVNVLTEADYAYFGGTDEAFANKVRWNKEFYSSQMGYTNEDLIENFCYIGDMQDNIINLTPGTRYYAFAIGVDEEFNANTLPESITFTTKAPPQTDLSFECQVSAIHADRIEGSIIPSNNEDHYICTIQLASTLEAYSNEYIYMEEIMALFENHYGSIEAALSQGPVDLGKFQGMKPNTEYVIVCFGWNEVPNTELFTYRFTTQKVDEKAEALTIQFAVEELEQERALIKTSPSNESYYLTINREWSYYQELVSSLGDEQAAASFLINEEIGYGAEIFNGNKVQFLTEGGASQGEEVHEFRNLKPGTDYVAIAMAVEITTGEIASKRVHLSEVYTTPEKILSEATVTIEAPYYYDGTRLAEIRPEEFAHCNGQAVVPYTVTPNEKATTWYTQYYMGDFISDGSTTDDIYNLLIEWGYAWDESSVDLNIRKGIAIIPWNYAHTLLGIAQDAEGNYGEGEAVVVNPSQEQVAPVEQFLQEFDPADYPNF